MPCVTFLLYISLAHSLSRQPQEVVWFLFTLSWRIIFWLPQEHWYSQWACLFLFLWSNLIGVNLFSLGIYYTTTEITKDCPSSCAYSYSVSWISEVPVFPRRAKRIKGKNNWRTPATLRIGVTKALWGSEIPGNWKAWGDPRLRRCVRRFAGVCYGGERR